MAICFGMIGIAWVFVTVVNTFRDCKRYKHENGMLRERITEIAYERNELEEMVNDLIRNQKSSQALNFFVRDCEMEKLRRENKKLRAFNETYRKQLEDRNHDR